MCFYKNNNLYHKIMKKLMIVAAFIVASTSYAFSQEITAIDFNGDLIGKVIPDGKVVSFDNQLIGNINADSLIINFKGEIVGGIVPQGIAIGNDNKLLGKVNNDGTVRLPSGKVIGKTLPNGIVVDEFFDVTGFVLFPGLIYSDSGKTVGRLTGDGSYTNLQGQKIGFVSADGYAYRKVGDDYVLDGKLISSKMVVSHSGEFIGSVSPGGEVTNFDAKVIGRIKANGYAYDSSNKIIGGIVSAGYAFDNYGKYIGFVNYNGEVVNKEQLVGRMTATGDIVDLSGKLIGYSVDFAATFTDFNGKYMGRLVPGGKVVKAKDVVGDVISRGLLLKDDKALGLKIKSGPVFDYRGVLIAHAQRNGSVVLFEGASLGVMKGDFAYNKSGQIMGSTEIDKLVVDLNNNILGMTDISSYFGSAEDKIRVSPFGYVFSLEDKISGYGLKTGPLYSDGNIIAELSLNGDVLNKGSAVGGKMTSSGVHISDGNRVLGRILKSNFITGSEGKYVGYLSNTNIAFDASGIKGKVFADGSIVETTKEDSKNLMPKIGQSYSGNLVISENGSLLGYAGVGGIVRDTSNSIIGQVIERNIVIDNNGSFLGEVVPYSVALDSDCSYIGVVTPKGDVRNTKDIYIGRPILNGQIISDGGSRSGYIVSGDNIVIDNHGNVVGVETPNGKVLNYNSENIGCLNHKGLLKNSDNIVFARSVLNDSAIDFDGKIIGRINYLGTLINKDGSSIGYMQSDDNVNSKTGTPLGKVLRYKFAFDNSNKLMGIILDDGTVLGTGHRSLGRVDFNGYILSGDERIGYALYDLYVYDDDNNVVGYIAKDGNVLSFNGQNIGRIDTGFVVDRTGKIASRGNRDYSIRNEIKLVIGELKLSGDLVDTSGKVIGKINTETGIIANDAGSVIGKAHALQYYGSKTGLREVYDENGRVIGYAGEDGSVVNEDGKIIALLNDDGIAVSANGDIIGGIGTDWYERAPKVKKKDDRNIEIGVIDRGIQEKSKRSLAVALTPDGEFLGHILEDGRVVDEAGNVLGRKMPDGLIIDDNGGLIGIEESIKPDLGGGIFVPSGTFGQGGAYGTGAGAGGNLGPGGGYGPGERYDPQRAAALAAAQEERRKNISVGKISSNVRREAFDGYQKNWDEQNIGKAISSWRVDLSEMILSDKPIPAVIARSIDSNNPTPITAIVERNIYAEEGRNIIIPAGSRILGEVGGISASTEATSNSAKVTINWQRLIRPDGSLFVFTGVTGDAQGRGGAPAYLDKQLFKKYTMPVLTTMLISGTTYMMAPGGQSNTESETPRQEAASDARENFLDTMNNIFRDVLQDKSDIQPLAYVPIGTRIMIYPSIDLWLRTPERDELEANAAMNKKDVFIDDNRSRADREEQEIKKKVSGNVVGGSSPGGSVVYEPEETDAEAQGSVLIAPDNNTGKKKKPGAPVTGATPPPPPPPPSFSGTPSRPSGSGSDDSGSSGGNIPQLF